MALIYLPNNTKSSNKTPKSQRSYEKKNFTKKAFGIIK